MKHSTPFTAWFLALAIGSHFYLCPGFVTAQEISPPHIQWLPPNQIELSWPAPGEGLLLQSAPDLSGSWSVRFPEVDIEGNLCRACFPVEGARQFFRLRENPGNLIVQYEAMGLILNHDGEPLPFAWVDDMGYADGDGLVAGNLPTGTSGWFVVHAEGHAPAIAWVNAADPDTMAVFEAWLTRFPVLAVIKNGDSRRLETDPAHDTGLSVTITASELATTPAQVGLAQIDLLNVAPRWAPLDVNNDLVLTQSFAIYACDTSGTPIPLADDVELIVDVRDGLGEEAAPVIARFDPTSGTWLSLGTAACSRIGPDLLRCILPAFSPLYGLFRPPPEPDQLPSDGFIVTGNGVDDSYKNAKDAVSAALANSAKELAENGSVSDESIQAELDAMADLVTAAIAYAAEHRDETGKMHLLNAFSACEMLGFNDLAVSLKEELEDLTNEMADDLAQSGDCGRIREMLKMLNQMWRLGADQNIESKLLDKITSLSSECDLWVGTIRYFYWVDNNPPVGSRYEYASGTPVWSEELQLTLATHPVTHQVTGEIAGMVRFPNAYFKTPSECEVSVEYSGLPGANAVNLQFGGTYDGITFALTDVTPASYSQPLSIKQYYIFKVKEDGECRHVDGASPNEIVYQDFFHSALVHGLAESPMITLQEMMENGTSSSYDGMEMIRGSEEFVAGEYAFAYPFTTGMVTWSFMHTKKVLPLDTP